VLPGIDAGVSALLAKFSNGWKIKKNSGKKYYFKKIPYQGIVGLIETEKGFIGAAGMKKEKEIIKALKKLIISEKK